jgi:polyisoprenoid-binding protein YceI
MIKRASTRLFTFVTATALAASLALAGCLPADSSTPSEAAAADSVSEISTPNVQAGTYKVDPAHSEIGFRVKHLGLSTVRGVFTETDAVIIFPDAGLSGMQAEATIQAASVNTNEADRDTHLRSADFFDAENHPTITFTDLNVVSVDGSEFTLEGDLTIRGVTKPIMLEGEYLGAAVDPWGNQRVGLTAEGTIDRTEFGLNWNDVLEAGGFLVGDEVTIALDIQALRQDV